ncbi:MAG TPA: RNA polymerase sigma factor [Thermoleophilaceae bacterium]|nr:RNA polymerase sigma factor [Thermoleophilaceae bacterium]
MRRVKTSDFERLYEEHAPRLYSFLAYRTGNPALAEDLVADTFERILTARKPFDPRRSGEKTWVYAIALNRLRDVARQSSAEVRALSRMPVEAENGNGAGGDGLEAVETRQIVMAALTKVDDDQREALALRYGADLSLAEIARVIGKPRSTVESRLYKGLKRLRAELADAETTAEIA